MSSTESSGAPAEATATTPAPDAAFPTFGATRGSGLARGKGKRPSAPSASSAAPTAYTPTAIEVVTAPREYTNPFAPVDESPAAPVKAETPAPVEQAPVVTPAPVRTYSAPVEPAPAPEASAPVQDEAPAELNILEPEQQKQSPAQTWESEGFRPARAERAERPERPRREESPREERPAEPVDIASIPPQFLYVRPGHTYVPTPRNWGGAPRERRSGDEGAPRNSEAPRHAEAPRETSAPTAAATEKSGGFIGWLKGLFGGSPAEAPAPVTAGSQEGETRREGGEHRRHRGGRNRGGHGGGGERRSRGGRGGRGRSGGYPPREGSSQGGI